MDFVFTLYWIATLIESSVQCHLWWSGLTTWGANCSSHFPTVLKPLLQFSGNFQAYWYFAQDGVADTKFCLVEDLAFPPVWHSFARGLSRESYCFLNAIKVYADCVFSGFWLGSVQNRSCFPTLSLISRAVWFHISQHCDWWSSAKYQTVLLVLCQLVKGLSECRLLQNSRTVEQVCQVRVHLFCFLTHGKWISSSADCGLLIGGWDTILIFTGESPTKFRIHTKRLILIASHNMCRRGECECVNTEEGADVAIGNIWEMYAAQTVEGITNLIKFKKFCSCDVRGRGAERSREFKRYFSWLKWSYCDWLNNFWEGHVVQCIEKL